MEDNGIEVENWMGNTYKTRSLKNGKQRLIYNKDSTGITQYHMWYIIVVLCFYMQPRSREEFIKQINIAIDTLIKSPDHNNSDWFKKFKNNGETLLGYQEEAGLIKNLKVDFNSL